MSEPRTWFLLPGAHPRWGNEQGPGWISRTREAWTPYSCSSPGVKDLGHLATQLSLWLTCSMVIGSHSPQGQPAQALQSPLGVLGGLWSSEKSPWQGGGGTSG